jgi:hypothetical protein
MLRKLSISLLGAIVAANTSYRAPQGEEPIAYGEPVNSYNQQP